MSNNHEFKDECCDVDLEKNSGKTLKRVLLVVLTINFVMFVVEFTQGFLAHSNALLADSLDMLADAFVYGISIVVLAKAPAIRAKASFVKGIVMLVLGLLVVGENVYKIFNPVLPTASTITLIGIIALLANVASFILLVKYKAKDLNMRSAWICSRNDIIANVGVIIAGLLITRFNSMWPDVIVGLVIASIVLWSSVKIIKDSARHISR